MNDPLKKQPPAVNAPNSMEVWPMVIRDVRAGHYSEVYNPEQLAHLMERRDSEGRKKHGCALVVDNGRDALADALQEALGLCAYTRQAAEALPNTTHFRVVTRMWAAHESAVATAATLADLLDERDGEGP